jgi:predicted phage terminase large subunit-like protein
MPAARRRLTRDAAVATYRAARRRKATLYLREFVRDAWPQVEPGVDARAEERKAAGLEPHVGDEAWNWHLDAICDHVQYVLEGWLVATGRMRADERRVFPEADVVATNLLINAAPATLKSKIVMVFAPAWMWLRAPDWSVGCFSGNPDNVARDSNACRDLVTSEWYRRTFAVTWEIRSDVDAVGKWQTTAGGSRTSRGLNAGKVGLHVDCVSGDTLVATEHGDVPIADLHAMTVKPRVWSMNHATGALELRHVLASREIPNRNTVRVRTQSGFVLDCTDDHRVWTEERGYEAAARVSGCSVSTLRRADESVPRAADDVRAVLDADARVRDVWRELYAGGSRAREARTAWCEGRAVLLEAVSPDPVRAGAGADARVRGMRQAVHAARAQGDAAVLLEGVCGRGQASAAGEVPRPAVRVVRGGDADRECSAHLLLDALQERGARGLAARRTELELQGEPDARRAVSCDEASDPSARSVALRSVQSPARTPSGSCGAPRRSRSDEQRPGEPAHALRCVPLLAPQVERDTVASVDGEPERGGRRAVSVYDIEVEGNHNFFAGGLLVHNCILLDDPDDAWLVYGEPARKEVRGHWGALGNRVNSLEHSVRIIVQQRVHVEDLTAHVVAEEGLWSRANPRGWLQLALAIEYDPRRRASTPLGWSDPRSVANDNMHPARFTSDVLASERRRLGIGYDAQYNQAPDTLEGGMFKRAWLRFWKPDGAGAGLAPRPVGCRAREELPAVPLPSAFDWVDLSLDGTFGSTSATASRVGLLAIAGKGPDRYVIADRTRRMGGVNEMVAACVELLERFPNCKRVVVEKKALGAAVVEKLQALLREADWNGVAVVEVDPKGDSKESRAAAIQPDVQNGNLFVEDGGEWLEAGVEADDPGFVGELCSFPNGKHDDRVDTLSQLMRSRATNKAVGRLKMMLAACR